MLVCGLINVSVERIAYKPLRNAPRLAPLITAIGMSFILQNVAIVWKGTETVSVDQTLPDGTVFAIGDVVYTWDRLFVVLVTVPVLVLLMWLVQYTRQGKAMRATAQDKDAAAMMGIDVNRTISFTFLIAGGLAGAAGVIFAFYYTTVRFDTGFTLGLIAFTAAVLGGIGNLPGRRARRGAHRPPAGVQRRGSRGTRRGRPGRRRSSSGSSSSSSSSARRGCSASRRRRVVDA